MGATADIYLNRVPKARILDAVREVKGEGTAQLLDHLRKGELATEAEQAGDVPLPAFFTTDLPGDEASMMAAE